MRVTKGLIEGSLDLTEVKSNQVEFMIAGLRLLLKQEINRDVLDADKRETTARIEAMMIVLGGK